MPGKHFDTRIKLGIWWCLTGLSAASSKPLARWISLPLCLMVAGGVSAVRKKKSAALLLGSERSKRTRGKRDNPGEPEARAARGNAYTMQERCRRAQVNFWPIAIEVDGHCLASFLKFFTTVYNAAKELTEQNPQAFKQY
jgi:hypothetical protein